MTDNFEEPNEEDALEYEIPTKHDVIEFAMAAVLNLEDQIDLHEDPMDQILTIQINGGMLLNLCYHALDAFAETDNIDLEELEEFVKAKMKSPQISRGVH